ncbi:MAG: hypothetical protein AAFS01_05510 [Pseudomonadota bacterium]
MATPTLDGDKIDQLKRRFDRFRAQEDHKDQAASSTKDRIEAWKAKRGEKSRDRGMGE